VCFLVGVVVGGFFCWWGGGWFFGFWGGVFYGNVDFIHKSLTFLVPLRSFVFFPFFNFFCPHLISFIPFPQTSPFSRFFNFVLETSDSHGVFSSFLELSTPRLLTPRTAFVSARESRFSSLPCLISHSRRFFLRTLLLVNAFGTLRARNRIQLGFLLGAGSSPSDF